MQNIFLQVKRRGEGESHLFYFILDMPVDIKKGREKNKIHEYEKNVRICKQIK